MENEEEEQEEEERRSDSRAVQSRVDVDSHRYFSSSSARSESSLQLQAAERSGTSVFAYVSCFNFLHQNVQLVQDILATTSNFCNVESF